MNNKLSFLKNFKWEFIYGEKGHNMAIYMAMENRTKEMYKVSGVKFKVLFYTIKDNFFTMYANGKDWERIANYLLKKIVASKVWLDNIFKNIYLKADKLIIFSRQLSKKDLKKLNNRQLFSLYKKFVDLFVAMRLYSSLPMNLEHYAPVFTNYLQNKLAKYIPREEDGFNSVFSIMTTPLKFSYLKNEELELFKLGLFLNNKNFSKKLKIFTDKFCWINYTFQGVPLAEDDFKKKIIEMKEKGINFSDEINKFKKDKNILKNKQLEIIKKYKFDKEIQKLFYYSQELVYLKFFRKGIFAESYYHCEFLLDEVAKRLNTTRKVVQGMFFKELEDALLKGKYDSHKIHDRIRDGYVLVLDGKSLDMDQKLRKIVMDNLEKVDDIKTDNFKGQVAMTGIAKGVVRIVNVDSDVAKMHDGDILVSRLTNPNLLPAMKKAAAIVTDAGGLACHAAIVARELKKPCVVGTKIATQVLKDGDMVEVNANVGVINILK